MVISFELWVLVRLELWLPMKLKEHMTRIAARGNSHRVDVITVMIMGTMGIIRDKRLISLSVHMGLNTASKTWTYNIGILPDHYCLEPLCEDLFM